MIPHRVFVTGGTGYIGRALVPELLRRGHGVRVLVRESSRARAPAGAEVVVGDALRADTFAGGVGGCGTLVHLIGTPRPSPAKAAEFRAVDLPSVSAAVAAAQRAGVAHLVYVSVAQPAPVMQAYVEVRRQAESIISDSGVPATLLRPWYVLGPGHRWPIMLLPLYALLARLPATRAGATRLGLVTRSQMVAALAQAVDAPPRNGTRVVDVPEIRRAGRRKP